MYNTKEAVFYLLEQLPSEDDGSIDLESSDDDELDPDFVPNHYDFVKKTQRCHHYYPFLYKILTPVMIMLRIYQMM